MTSLKLKASDTALVIVDMQERLLPVIHDHEDIIANTRLLIHAARVLNLPVIATTQYSRGLGPTHPRILDLIETSPAIDKLTFSCFGAADFTPALAALGRRTLLLCGVEAHICVLQTGIDALTSGYSVHLITDATGSRTPRNADLGRRRLGQAGATLSSAEMAIYEALGASGTPEFKSLLPYFK